MLKPWDLSDYSDEDASNYASVEELIWSYIINLIGNEASKHDDTDNEWVNELLNHADDVRQYAARITVSPTKHASKQLHTKLGTISQGNIKQAEKWLREATGKQVDSIKDSQHFKQIVENQLTETDNYLNLARRNMSTNAYRTFKGIVGEARQSINSGMVPSKAISKTSERWAERGIPALIDKAGRSWSPDVYIRTVINSGINSATNETELLRYRQYGSLVKVSSHIGCRPSHLQYQDHVYSLDGNIDKYPDFESSTGYGTITGIGGINCRHYTIPYVDGYGAMSVPQQSDDENAARYQLEQTQRRLEREVRKAKRQLVAAQKLDDEIEITHYRELVHSRQYRLRKYVKKNGLIRQTKREQVVNMKSVDAENANHLVDRIQQKKADFEKLQRKFGPHGFPKTLDSYRSALYNKHDSKILHAYTMSRKRGTVEPVVRYQDYVERMAEIDDKIIGLQTSAGQVITGFANHMIDRTFGASHDASHNNVKRIGVDPDEIKQILRDSNPLSVRDEATKYRNENGYVIVNKRGKLVTVVPRKGKHK
ncbi:hypothetical protein KBP51_06370 [Lactiplantibacillus pentosus]|uniref:phage minor capsid protein n=1 Tax=Lactiplantibacillus pentosus TaxID=1589 RepID=UPI00132F6B45|nr:phage minor capsid protein [Lactiplantibacillus pentosus]MBQ0836091.1 hypothetical protein [Lactiplantibacillus pentosus]